MAYTILDCREITQPLVAIYTDRDEKSGFAQPIFGLLVYRDMDNKGSENLLVPATADDMTSTQTHNEPTRRDLILRLPRFVINSPELYQEACRTGEIDVWIDDEGIWRISE